ncbi:ABC bile acid transporter [Cordyceps javanica]|uniref:ABC bile acid transporter n=1 Tax=Cordyceps javanica TaxID=43265 RepID=A0A545URX4_9HYPO|nr:ABC bile acid transporter [Cordyceps javanica]
MCANADLQSLLMYQSFAVCQQKSIQQRYKMSIYTAASSLILIASLFYEHLMVPHNLFWPQLVVAAVVLFILLSFPRHAVVFCGNTAVLNESGVSILDWVFFSWGLHREHTALPATLKLQDLPRIPASQTSSAMRRKYDVCDQTKELWLQLAIIFRKPLLIQWTLVLLEKASEFGSRYVVYNLLRSLEMHSHTVPWIWTWVVLLPLSLLGVSICDNWSGWIGHTRIQLPMLGLLQTLLFEKSMRLRSGVNGGPAGAKQDANCPSLMDAIESHRYATNGTIARTFLDAHDLPMAALEIGLHSVYLSHLLGFTTILVGGIPSVLAIWISRKLSNNLRRAQAEHLEATERTSHLVSEALHGLRQIRLSSMEKFWQDRIFVSRNDNLEAAWKASVQKELINLVATLGPVLFASLTIYIHAFRTGQFSPSVAFTSVNLFSNLHAVIKQLPTRFASLHRARLSYAKLQLYFNQPEQIRQSILADDVSLRDANLSWSGDGKESTLKGVNLKFPRNGVSLITGQVGSGKSLLLSAILEETMIQSGKLLKPAAATSSNLSTASDIVAGSVAFVSQPPWIEDCSIKDNIIFGYTFDAERYHNVLQVCGLTHDIDTLGNGDLTVAGTDGSSLSGGQKWRLAFARALYSPAEFIISEDILAAVDTPVARHICDNALAGEILLGRTMILATHHPEYCSKLASCLVSLHNGSAMVEYMPKSEPRAKFPSQRKEQKPKYFSAKAQPASKGQAEKTQTQAQPANLSKDWAIFCAYAKRTESVRGYLFAVPIVLCSRFLSASNSWWLAKWTSQESSVAQPRSTSYDAGVYLWLSVAGAVLLSVQALAFTRMGHSSSQRLFESLMGRVLKARLSWIESTPPGQLVQTLDSDIYAIDHRMAPQIIGILSSTVNILLICTTLIYHSLSSSPYTIVSSTIMLLFYILIAQKALETSKKLRPVTNSCGFPVSNHISSAQAGLSTIRAFGKVGHYVETMRGHIDRANTAYTHMALGHSWLGMRLGIMGSMFVAAVTAATVRSRGTASSTGLAVTLALQLRQALNITIGQINVTRTGLNAIGRVLALASIPSEEGEEGAVAPSKWPSEGQVDIQNLGVRYAENLPWALNDVSFSLQPGQRLGVVGRTGAGKSSLINALLRFVDATTGKIMIDRQDVSHISRRCVRDTISVIPQDAFLFSGNLRSNVDVFGQHSDEEIIAALRSVHLTSFGGEGSIIAADLDREILSRGSNISHGQRQLICLARVMLEKKSHILILDEATSGVDRATETAIRCAIRENFKDTTILVVAHKLITVADFDSVLVLSRGEVVESGTPKHLLAAKGEFWNMVELSEDSWKIKEVIHQDKEL